MSPATDVDAAVIRLFALLGVPPPTEGSVVLDFHEGSLLKVRPTSVITVRREKGLAPKNGEAHTRQP